MTGRRIRAAVVVVWVAAMVLATGGQQARAHAVTVQPVGVRVVMPGYGDDNEALRAFSWQAGTTVALLVQRPAGNLIEIDTDASTLDLFTDEAGNDLLEGEGWGQTGFGMSPDISEDSRAALMEIGGKQVPAHGTNQVRAKGSIKLVTASGKQRVSGGLLKLVKDEAVKLGSATFTVTQVKASQWDDGAIEVTLKTTDDTQPIAGIVFENAGKPIEARRSMSSTMTFNGSSTTEWSYSLQSKVKQVTVSADLWQGLQTHDVPFDVRVGIGLGK